jgi:hypothetical protein
MEESIVQIKKIMTDVSTGLAKIQDINDRYKILYNEISETMSLNKIKNPNPYSDLWEFYQYWSKKLPKYSDRRDYIIKIYKNLRVEESLTKNNSRTYVHTDRIRELKLINNKDYDLIRMIRLCEELNIAFSSKSLLSTIIIVRAIIDHTPPIFKLSTFSEVVNNYKGSKSFKDSMKNLESSSRKIADQYLHTQIRNKEVLPNQNQVDFSNDLDVLLAEIYRILK